MTFGELKQYDIYKKSYDVSVCVNKGSAINEEYYLDVLDGLCITDIEYHGNNLSVNLVCKNWDERFSIENWVAN